MKAAINLLQETKHLEARVRRMGLALQTVSIVVLVAVAAVAFLLMSYTFLVARQRVRLDDAIARQKSAIEALRPLESKHVLVKQKLSASEKVVSEPSIPYTIGLAFFENASQQSAVQGMNTGRDITGVTIGGTVGDVFRLVSLLDRLVSFSQEHGALRLTGEGFNRSPDGEYQYSLILETQSQ